MKTTGFVMIGMSIVMASALRADVQKTPGADQAQESVRLKKDEKKLEKLEANRLIDSKHNDQTQQEFREGTAALSGHDEQQLQDLQRLKSVESQIMAGKKRGALAKESYKEAVDQFGPGDERSVKAKLGVDQSRQEMDPLLESRKSLKENIHQGRRRVHDDKTVLSIEKRAMDSDARYSAADERKIEKKEQNIVDDRRAMTPSFPKPESPSSKIDGLP